MIILLGEWNISKINSVNDLEAIVHIGKLRTDDDGETSIAFEKREGKIYMRLFFHEAEAAECGR